MRVIRGVTELRGLIRAHKAEGRRIGFVPTMGFLHAGHASLIKQSTLRCDITVVSIFVNPTQFGPEEDLASYPRDLERDQALCLEHKTNLLFLPDLQEIYPTGFQTFVNPGALAEPLCGYFRPGHFRGVTTIVSKLFNIVQPDLAFFGQKDLQQFLVIRRMVRDLNQPVELVMVPTLRESDGLAMSSRNAYLSSEDRRKALCISRALFAAQEAFQGGERNAWPLLQLAQAQLKDLDRVQYCELVEIQSLQPISRIEGTSALCIAGFLGRTRLIDNILLSTGAYPSLMPPLPG